MICTNGTIHSLYRFEIGLQDLFEQHSHKSHVASMSYYCRSIGSSRVVVVKFSMDQFVISGLMHHSSSIIAYVPRVDAPCD
jgi:hypothetical protein